MKYSVLKYYREKAGKKICDASNYWGNSPKTIHKWEQGGTPRYKEQLADLLEYYGVDSEGKKEVIYNLYGSGCDHESFGGLSIIEIWRLEESINHLSDVIDDMKQIISMVKTV